ncbi:hypothetical protein BC832DRAFT_592317 [Gaertneriomyces semiglobifer]|nr:hypothetical protein BC832DRAFT_592317 [Gaertneriomyces semiglobifer]
MKVSAILATAAALTVIPAVSAKCEYQSHGDNLHWRLTTYKSKDCINKIGGFQGGGLGYHQCFNLKPGVKSFIFSADEAGLIEPGCFIFFYDKPKCTGTQVGRSEGEWKKSAVKSKLASFAVNCHR